MVIDGYCIENIGKEVKMVVSKIVLSFYSMLYRNGIYVVSYGSNFSVDVILDLYFKMLKKIV